MSPPSAAGPVPAQRTLQLGDAERHQPSSDSTRVRLQVDTTVALRRVADVVIAGAGMAGVAAAHELAVRRGIARVVLVEPREPLSLTSSKGTEAYRNYWPGPDDTMVRFMDRSIDLLEALDRQTGHAFELNRRGYVFLTADSEEAERLRRHEGPTTTFVEGSGTIRARYPFVTERVRAM